MRHAGVRKGPHPAHGPLVPCRGLVSRSKKKFQLEQDEGTIIGEQNLRAYISEFYKKLFGAPAKNNFTLVETNTHDLSQLSTEENEILIAEISEEEVFEAIKKMENNKAPGPDGFPAEFY